MKKILFLFFSLILSSVMYGQTPIADGRIADTTTIFTVNMPVGTKLYVSDRSTIYVCRIASAAGQKLSSKNGTGTAFANWVQVATGVGHAEVTIGTMANGLSIAAGQVLSMDTARANGINKGTASFTAADFNSSAGNISIDYTNGQKATASQPGFMTAAQAGMLDTTTLKTGLATNYDLLGKLGTGLTNNKIFVGNASNVATAMATASTGDVTITSNDGSNATLTIGAGKVTLSQMANMDQNKILGRITSGSGAPEQLTGANVRTISQTNTLVQKFENTTADSANYTCTLSNTPQAIGTISVSLNGQELDPGTQYAIIMTNKVRVAIPTSKYDKFVIRYNY
jgi:hypothetical protein